MANVVNYILDDYDIYEQYSDGTDKWIMTVKTKDPVEREKRAFEILNVLNNRLKGLNHDNGFNENR